MIRTMQKRRGRPPKPEGAKVRKAMVSLAPEIARAVDTFQEEFGVDRSSAIDFLVEQGLRAYLEPTVIVIVEGEQ